MKFGHHYLGGLDKIRTFSNMRGRDTVPAIVFKMDILAQKVNFMKLKKQAFFQYLRYPI